MSSSLYPTLPGLTFEVVRTPVWNTEISKALSGKRSALGTMMYPLMHFELTYSILRDDIIVSDIKALVGLFNAMKGQYDTFLFLDPDFNTITPANATNFGQFGTVVAGTTTYQLQAWYQNARGPGYGEAIQNTADTPILYANGATIAAGDYSIGPTGIVTFSTLPAVGALLSWSGSWYYRCAFDENRLQTVKFLNLWWSIKKVPFTSIKL